MDFALPYTEEQERFRKEVRSWLEENIPQERRETIDSRDQTEEYARFWREKPKDLAKKGWLFPTFPTEYGGGGLTGEHETILQEEFHRAGVPGSLTTDTAWALPALLVWATEEQKQRWLVPFLTGEQIGWEKLTEPHSGADLADYQSRAVRDGDDWLLTGQNVFITGRHSAPHPDWIYGPMLTDPDSSRHRNLGFFMIPCPAPGLEIRKMDLVQGREQHQILLDNVRVPGDHLIGGDHQGWQVTQTTLEQEHGGRGRAFPRDEVVDNLVSYAKGTEHDGSVLGSNPVLQQTTMDAVIESHVLSLLLKRTYWMYTNRMDVRYQGNVANVHGRESSIRNATRVRDVMGMYCLLGTKEPGAPLGGAQEVNQRSKAGQNHGGGSTNIAKVVLARRIGISRTQERAAPTPATATTHGS